MAAVRTKHLALDQCKPEDLDHFVEMERDPAVMRFLNGGFAVDRARVGPGSSFLMPEGTEDYVWTARRISCGAFVGWFCLWPAGGGSAELGYRLRKTEWGQGLASEGAAALIEWGFRSAGYRSITACALTGNAASRRVLEKQGLRHLRTDPVKGGSSGGDESEAFYELMRSEWTGS
ncbi:MAG: N-acetyltransferase [Mesorhizobium amorphae]|nr:MAG: N-acetyltransferase [Mesorhizobium amorphae]